MEKAIAEAMAAGYAQGVEATEARAIKRIDELSAKLKDAKHTLSVCGKGIPFAEKLLKRLLK